VYYALPHIAIGREGEQGVERMLALTVDPAHNDYAVFTRIQVHIPDRGDPGGGNYAWPGVLYALVNGKRQTITIEQ
jgi:hypothetical protein